jgi:hypothetical protein
MNILDYNSCSSESCSHYPECGWNIKLGGVDPGELQALQAYLKDKVQEDLTRYDKKLATRPFFEPKPSLDKLERDK